MIIVRERGGRTLSGKSPESIARRVYGRRAYVQFNQESVRNAAINGWVEATVLTPADGNGSWIVARWLIDPADLHTDTEESLS